MCTYRIVIIAYGIFIKILIRKDANVDREEYISVPPFFARDNFLSPSLFFILVPWFLFLPPPLSLAFSLLSSLPAYARLSLALTRSGLTFGIAVVSRR